MTRLRPPRQFALLVAGLALIAIGWLALAPTGWLGSYLPENPDTAQLNASIIGEVRATAVLAGLALALLALLSPRLTTVLDGMARAATALDGWLRTGRRWHVVLFSAASLVAISFAVYSITRHNAFNSKAYDLGLHSQVIWNTSQGRLFASSVEVDNYLGDHVSPIMLLLAPLYWAWADPRTLLVVQALALAAGAIPLAWLTRRLLMPHWPEGAHLVALVLALAYLTAPALGFTNRFEFHEEVLAVPLLLLAFWCLETRRPAPMSLALLLALLCKEDVGLTVAAFGLWAAWRQPALRKVGLAWLAIGLLWSMAALLVIIPAFRGAPSDTLDRYAWLGGSPPEALAILVQQPGSVVKHLLGDPRRFWFLLKLLLPTGLFALLSPAALIAAPSVVVNWLAGNLYQASFYFHYAAVTIPVVFAAAAYGLERLAKGNAAANAQRAGSLAVVWLLACALLAGTFDQFWQRNTGASSWENYGLERRIDAEPFSAAAALLPADGVVATTEAYAAHLANRQGLHLLHDPRIGQVVDRLDWVLIDLSDHRYGVNPKLLYALLRWTAERRELEVCFFGGDVVLLGRACGDAAAAAAYESRLAELQASAAAIELDPRVIDALGQRYFAP